MRRTRSVRRCSTQLATRIPPVPVFHARRQRWCRPWLLRATADLARCLGRRHHSKLTARR
eukprot:15440225-Alexandrium_andersonii.AAC.1